MHPESTHAQLIPKAQTSDCIKHSVLNLFLYFSLFIITMRADVVKKLWIWVKTPTLGAVALVSGSWDVTLGRTFLVSPPLDVYDLGHALQLSWRHISFIDSSDYKEGALTSISVPAWTWRFILSGDTCLWAGSARLSVPSINVTALWWRSRWRQQRGPTERIILNRYFVNIRVENLIIIFIWSDAVFLFILLVTPMLCNSAFLLISSSLYSKYESWQTHLCCVFSPREGETHANLSLHPGYVLANSPTVRCSLVWVIYGDVSCSSACLQTHWPFTAWARSRGWMAGVFRSCAPPCCSSWMLAAAGHIKGRSKAATPTPGPQTLKVSTN